MKKNIIIAIVCMVISTSSITAQTFSLEIGGGYLSQRGHFEAPCGCTFAQGSGFDIHFNSGIDLFSASNLSVGIGPGIEYQRFVDVEVDKETTHRISNGDQQISRLLYVVLSPYLHYSLPTLNLFVLVSPSIGYLLSKKFEHIASAVSGESEGNSSYDIDIRRVRFSLLAAVGYSIEFDKYRIAPMLGFEFPLSMLRNDPSDFNWKVSSIKGSVLVTTTL